ncbi:MAG: bifunctional heptose 7-phosphate kinase/heptose 1-phosphate adenyltransferase [Synergistaceae bacterium]|jgi:D-beta-D-heptose 7-phosphate kinase/D-beta-D-heptose 1-phosphate adenosyltransferase|nr:bifunctional heptose 7-phosphate kinase/heptose 1-phosphate adenyltransferase [Synergistaceae bacterium]
MPKKDTPREGTLFDFLRSGRAAEVGIAILGDVVLDRYLTGSTSRVSREAPLPVVVCDRETDNLGGAGNVAMNLRGLGCRVFLVGAVGKDDGAGRIRSHLDENAVGAKLFERTLSSTLTKTRLICGGQQVARFDHEKIEPLDEELAGEAVSWLEELLRGSAVKAVILSDYGLGFCTPRLSSGAIEAAQKYRVPVFVDPRGADWSKYRGATVVTPNLSELAAVYGPVPNENDAVARAGQSVRRNAALEWLLVTRSSQGMTLVGEGGTIHLPARPVEVFDVSGAGDTVIACLAVGVAAGFSMSEATRFSNEAAQIVVTKAGTYPIAASDLPAAPRRVARQAAVRLCRQWKEEGQRVVFTNGCFDVLHAGHIDSLERAKELGDRLVVGLNSDRSVRALKGENRPVNGAENRARLLAALRVVDLVVVFDEDTPAELLSELRPNVLAKGGDYKAEDLPGREFADEVAILPLVEGLSTTETIRRIEGAESKNDENRSVQEVTGPALRSCCPCGSPKGPERRR